MAAMVASVNPQNVPITPSAAVVAAIVDKLPNVARALPP
jgi:hypothetical protein